MPKLSYFHELSHKVTVLLIEERSIWANTQAAATKEGFSRAAEIHEEIARILRLMAYEAERQNL